MRINVFGPLLERPLNWKRAQEGMKFFDGLELEFAETLYHPTDCNRTLRVILVRALKRDHNSDLFRNSDFDYAAFATDLGMHEYTAIDVIRAVTRALDEGRPVSVAMHLTQPAFCRCSVGTLRYRS